MLRRILKWAAIVLIVLVATGAVLYAVGLRVVLYGGGAMRLAFVESESDRAARIERDREAQRARAPASPSPSPVAPAPAAPRRDFDGRAAAGAGERRPGGCACGAPPPTGPTSAARTATDIYRERPILTNWPADGLTPMWKQPVGGGYASFVIAGGRAFTIEQRGPQEVAAAYDVATGRELWTSAWTATFHESMGGDGPRATPTWSDGRVYALGAPGRAALPRRRDRRARVAHEHPRRQRRRRISNGACRRRRSSSTTPSSSCRAAAERAIRRGVRSAHREARVVGARRPAGVYSSPMLVTLAGVRQILVFSASRVMGLTPDRGDVLWEYPVEDGLRRQRGAADRDRRQPRVRVVRLRRGAAVVELTRSDADGFQVREVWRNIRMKNQFTSSVLHDGFIYGLDESILACVDAATGELKWKGGRYGYGQVILASGHLIVLTRGR